MHKQVVKALILAMLVSGMTVGCATKAKRVGVLSPIQLRMADPLVMHDAKGALNPPIILLQQYSARKASDKNDDQFIVNPTKPVGKPRVAAFVVDDEPYKNRVDLVANATYKVNILLPQDFEKRRLALLQLKMETLYQAIKDADDKLRDNTSKEVQLLDEATRTSLINESSDLRTKIADKQKAMIVQGASQSSIEEDVRPLVDQLAVNEQRLRDDDAARDKLLSPDLVDSLVDQIEQWRAQLNTLKSRIVSLELMVQNTNKPYPRVINGWLQTKSQTPFTMSGAIPFVVEDEYLDWIRQDRVVTIVSYDPNETPEDAKSAERRAAFTDYWPQDKLMVIAFNQTPDTVPRSATAGTRPNSRVNQTVYNDVRATTFKADNGVQRTYLISKDSKTMWVFGPDVDSPPNVEVWTQSETGEPVQKLYPPDAREKPDEVYIRQIAGVEGGAFDPIEEARRRGKIVAVTRLGNKRETTDVLDIRTEYPKQLKKAQEDKR